MLCGKFMNDKERTRAVTWILVAIAALSIVMAYSIYSKPKESGYSLLYFVPSSLASARPAFEVENHEGSSLDYHVVVSLGPVNVSDFAFTLSDGANQSMSALPPAAKWNDTVAVTAYRAGKEALVIYAVPQPA
jgi:hypothetical protein